MIKRLLLIAAVITIAIIVTILLPAGRVGLTGLNSDAISSVVVSIDPTPDVISHAGRPGELVLQSNGQHPEAAILSQVAGEIIEFHHWFAEDIESPTTFEWSDQNARTAHMDGRSCAFPAGRNRLHFAMAADEAETAAFNTAQAFTVIFDTDEDLQETYCTSFDDRPCQRPHTHLMGVHIRLGCALLSCRHRDTPLFVVSCIYKPR